MSVQDFGLLLMMLAGWGVRHWIYHYRRRKRR